MQENISSKRRIALVAIFLAIVFTATFMLLPANNTAYAKAVVVKETGGGSSMVLDYSGKGTVFPNNVGGGSITASGNCVIVPYYRGSYEHGALNWWIWHGWSGWSTSNNKTNDYTTYRGETATEYDVESRTEHQYYAYETQLTYRTRYWTVYQGTEWYNILIPIISSSTSGYGGAKSGYKIVEKYTTQEISGTKQVRVDDSEWRTSKPVKWLLNSTCSTYSTRTTYRYRSRNMDWKANTNPTTTTMNRYYSLYNKDGTPISNGVKWSYLPSLSGDPDYDSIILTSNTWIDVYYITSKDLIQLLADDMEAIEDSIGKYGLANIIFDIGSFIASYFIPTKVGLAIDIALILTEISDSIMNDLKAGTINTYQDLLKAAERQNLTLVIQDTNRVYRYSETVYVHDAYYGHTESVPKTDYYRETTFGTTTQKYVSMKAFDNNMPSPSWLYDTSYGSITYSVSRDEIISMIKSSLNYNYPIILPWNW